MLYQKIYLQIFRKVLYQWADIQGKKFDSNERIVIFTAVQRLRVLESGKFLTLGVFMKVQLDSSQESVI